MASSGMKGGARHIPDISQLVTTDVNCLCPGPDIAECRPNKRAVQDNGSVDYCIVARKRPRNLGTGHSGVRQSS